jgi:DNA polymerase-3 subunit chi
MNKEKAEVTLYQLTTHPLEKVLPRILEKVYDGGLRALVVTDSSDHMQQLNSSLWTYSSGAFLPHGADGNKLLDPLENPIWISTEMDNKNKATVLVLTNGCQVDDLSGYTRCVDIFDGNDPTTLSAAQLRQKTYQQNGHSLVYWKQSLNGNWDQVPLNEGH